MECYHYIQMVVLFTIRAVLSLVYALFHREMGRSIRSWMSIYSYETKRHETARIEQNETARNGTDRTERNGTDWHGLA
jgi:hypothetical protein